MNGIDKIRQCCNQLPFSVTLLNRVTADIARDLFEKIQNTTDICNCASLDGITTAKLQKYLVYYDFVRVLPDDEHDRMSCWTKGVTFLNKVFSDSETADEKNCYLVLRAAIEDRNEKYDGRGSHKGKHKNDICPLAQILSVSEIAAESILRCDSVEVLHDTLGQYASSQFDPRIVNIGIEVVNELLYQDKEYFEACDSDEFMQMDYQSVVECNAEDGTFSVCGYENRMILKDSELDVLTPEIYLPVAERNGRIVPLTDMYLEKLCRVLAMKRYDPLFRVLPIWVNISPVCLKRKSFTLNFRRLLTKYHIHPECFVILVTETALGYEDPQIPKTIASLREIGVKVVLDHFGSEYSSLAELDNIEVDAIRIDPMFAESVSKNTKAAEIVRSITELAGKLGIDVAVSGVRDESSKEILSAMSFRYMQGDIFGIWGLI